MVLLRLFFAGMVCYGTAITAQDLSAELNNFAAKLNDLAKTLKASTSTPTDDGEPTSTEPVAAAKDRLPSLTSGRPKQQGKRPPTRKPTSSTEPTIATEQQDSTALPIAETIVPEDETPAAEAIPSTPVDKPKVRPTPPPKPSSFETMTQEEARTLLDLSADQTYTEIDIKTKYEAKKASTPVQDHYQLAYASSLLNALLMSETEARSLLDLTGQPTLTEELIKTALADKLKTASEAQKTDLKKAALKLKHHGVAQQPTVPTTAPETPAQPIVSEVEGYIQAAQDVISTIHAIEATLSTWFMSWVPGAKMEYSAEDITNYVAKIAALQNAETSVAKMLRQLTQDQIAQLNELQTKLRELTASVTNADAKTALEKANQQLRSLVNNKSKPVEEQLD